MPSSFNILPPEIVQKCVEFLDFDLVSGDLKAVSMGRGLEAWSDTMLAARFTRKFHVRYGYSRSYVTEAEMYFHGARLWSWDWVDRTKAAAFIAEMERIYDASPNYI